MRILFIDTMHPLLEEGLIAAGHECTGRYDSTYDELLKVIGDFEGIIIRSRIRLDKNFLKQADRLKFIARAGAGMESIDVKYAAERNIACLNSPEGNPDAVGEHAIGMLLSLMNNMNRADAQVRKGDWNRESNRGHELGGRTVGIIGYGNMGMAFARKLKGFDCRVLAYDKYRIDYGDEAAGESDMESIFNEADILSLHVPLTPETEYMVDDPFINRFQKNIYLVNTARGKCVRISDLVKNLKSGKIAGACLDVLEYEDTSFEKFSIGSEMERDPDWSYLIRSDKVGLSPHIAGWTVESLQKTARVLLKKITELYPTNA
jgi:D-3-phosphoglycerate dehydrogenase